MVSAASLYAAGSVLGLSLAVSTFLFRASPASSSLAFASLAPFFISELALSNDLSSFSFSLLRSTLTDPSAFGSEVFSLLQPASHGRNCHLQSNSFHNLLCCPISSGFLRVHNRASMISFWKNGGLFVR